MLDIIKFLVYLIRKDMNYSMEETHELKEIFDNSLERIRKEKENEL